MRSASGLLFLALSTGSWAHGQTSIWPGSRLPNYGALPSQADDWKPILSAVQSALASNRPVQIIGELDGDRNYTFGSISAIEVSDDGRVRVIDRQALEIKAFDANGKFKSTIGRGGGGPGEFRIPAEVQTDQNGDVHILDLRGGQLSVFRDGPNGPEFVRSLRTDSARAFCRIANEYFVLTPAGPNIVRRVGPNGLLSPGFGKPTGVGDAKAFGDEKMAAASRRRQDQALMYCDASRDLIVLVHKETPLVRSFSRNGVPRWETQLQAYRKGGVAPVQGRPGWFGESADPQSGTRHQAHAVFRVTDSVIAISLIEDGVTRRSVPKYELRMISLQNGRELARISTHQKVVGLTRTHVYTYADLPYPRIMVYALPPSRATGQ